ncbi:MAG: YtxH domain-containing protein [Myxococcales bacterium]|nr:YtxH domain-containing protein [Myxococcales bacterium]
MSDGGFSGSQLALAFLAGAAAGAAVALLTAPRSGAETRAQIRDFTARSRDRATSMPKALKGAALAARDAFNVALEEQAQLDVRES